MYIHPYYLLYYITFFVVLSSSEIHVLTNIEFKTIFLSVYNVFRKLLLPYPAVNPT